MAAHAIVPVLKTYSELRQAVEATLVRGQRKIDRAKLETYWRTGALIDRHLTAEEHATGYGTQTMRRLARDLKFEESVLYRCLRFTRLYPIFAARRNLLWGHYRVLIDIPDAAERRALEREADREEWTTKALELRVRALNAVNVTPPKDDATGETADTHKPLVPQRGTPGLHLIVDRGDGLAVDLGFKLYWPLTAEQTKRFSAGDIVRIASDDSIRRANDATKADLFTYAAILRRVVDGDTLVVALEVSPGVFLEQKLRLRGLDCPEMSTPEGRVAKRFVDALVARTTAVVINTTKPDKYDRYLADVFLSVTSDPSADSTGSRQAGAGQTKEIFLNAELLSNGQAVRKDPWEFGDREPQLIG